MKCQICPRIRREVSSLQSFKAIFSFLIISFSILHASANEKNKNRHDFLPAVSADTVIFPFGENSGYYGAQFTDQNIYDLMYASGARAVRPVFSLQQYLQYGVAPFAARFNYPYQTKGMRNNVFTFTIAPPQAGGSTYTGQSTKMTAGGNRSLAPASLNLPVFNSDSSINTNNLWAMFVADVYNATQGSFQVFEAYNEPDINNNYVNAEYDSSFGLNNTWATIQPTPDELINIFDSLSVEVRIQQITWQVIHHLSHNTAKVATGGISQRYWWRQALKLGIGQYVDVLSMHMYPYYGWTYYTNQSPNGPGNQRFSDMLLRVNDSLYSTMQIVSGQQGFNPNAPHMITETNTPRWNYDVSTSAGSQNKRVGNNQIQRNYMLKGVADFWRKGFSPIIWFQTGEAADSGVVSATEFDAEGMYKNLNTASVGNTSLTQSGQAIQTMQRLCGNYTMDPSQPTFASGIDGILLDSAGYKIYMLWAKTSLDLNETASGTYTLPTGKTYKEYIWNGTSPGTVSGTINLIGDPYILVQTTSGSAVTANAGSAQSITLPTNSIALSGSASTVSNSTISSYAWSQVSGPATATFSAATAVSNTASNLVAGTYVFSLKVKDANNDSSSATVTITVINSVVNVPPVISAGTNQSITLPTNTTTLSGTATAGTGAISSYLWTQTSGPGTATIATSSALKTTVSGLTAGTYVFQLKVADINLLSSLSTITVTVNAAPNQPPVANAGANQSITLPTNSVTLNGTASKDPDGTIASYSWTKISGPTSGTIVSATSATTVVNTLVQGTYLYKLTVTDNSGATGSDTVTVTVNAAANQPPVANAGTAQTITLPVNSASLNGSASSDPDGTIASYKWSQVSGPSTATINNFSTATPTVTSLVAGTYVFQLLVTDNSGATATAQVKVIVNAAIVNQPPVANAGANQTITLPTNSVTLDGTGSKDPDGTIASYSWTKISGPTSGTIVSATTATTVVNTLIAGTYIFQLTVTDNSGASASDTVTITVNPAVNQPPVANAGTSKTITLPTNSVSLDGTKSTDPDGTIASYAWSQVSGPSTATITNGTTASPTISSLVAGTYIFQLTVTDNSGATSTAQVKVTVNAAANVNPIANAGANQSITLPLDSVLLDGSSSVDPNGTIVSYSWAKISGPTSGTIVNATSATTEADNLAAGTYIYSLTVTDNSGAKASDTVTINVKAAVNKPPVANAGSGITIILPTDSASLDGTKSSDADGTIVSYNWTEMLGVSTATIINGNTATPQVSNLVAGNYYFQLTVTDNNGATSKATVKVTVIAAANIPPVANAGSYQVITLPVNSVTVNGSSSVDPDGTIIKYAWTKVSGPTSGTIVNPSSVTTVINNLVQGTYVYKLTVTDNKGATSSDTVNIIVNAAANIPPVAEAGPNQTISLPTNSVSLDGTASTDADGTIASYVWTQVSGPSTAIITNGTTATPTVSSLVAGSYMFKLTVTDNSGATSSDQVKIIVNAAINQPPVANAGSDITITLPANSVTLSGSGSTDADGTIISYSWTKVSGTGSTITNANAINAAVTGLQAGVYVYKLTVTDNTGATSSDNITVTVDTAATVVVANQLPVANAGTAQSMKMPIGSMTLNGTKSYDPDGTIAAYNWIEISGPSNATIANNNAATATVTGIQSAGSYIFKLTVTDNKGATASAQVTETVSAATVVVTNKPPVANAGTDQTITLPTNTTKLDGTKSTDADGTIVSYTWSQVSGATSTITNGSTSTPTISNLVAAGNYSFQLTVTDNSRATSSDTVVVIVNAATVVVTNKMPVANAGPDQNITLPTNSTKLDGTKSTDADGTIVTYAWTQVSGATPTISDGTTATPTVSNLDAGIYIFKLTVTDNNGATATDTVIVSVNAAAPVATNKPPVAIAGNDTTIAIPASTAILNGSASFDVDGTISSYQWVQVSGPAFGTIATSNTAITSVTNLVAGQYLFRLTVTDNNGATSVDSVKVSVVSNLRSASSSLMLYPNPARSVINLRLINDATGAMKISIVDMAGRTAMVISTNKPQTFYNEPINISTLQSGFYAIQIVIGTQTVVIGKFLKQ